MAGRGWLELALPGLVWLAPALGACGEGGEGGNAPGGAPMNSTTAAVGLASASARGGQVPPVAKPATWSDIGYIYHGVLLDREQRPIPLDPAEVDRLLESFFRSLSASMKHGEGKSEPAPAKLRTDKLLKGFDAEMRGLPPEDIRLAKLAALRDIIALAPPGERATYLAKLNALAAVATADGAIPTRPSKELQGKLKSLQIDASAISPAVAGPETEYMKTCRSADVPLPPPWPGPEWQSHGSIPPEYTFAKFGSSVRAEVISVKSEAGVCVALPRYGADDGLQAMGVICQSKKTGKACFWDNIDLVTGTRLEGKDVSMNPAAIQGAYELEENCTSCHRGENAFLIHPKTPLGMIQNRSPQVRYSPIGTDQWTNPQPLAEEGSGACADCHEIAAPNPSYCGLVRWAATNTMPSPDEPAGWETPIDEFKAHLESLRAGCTTLTPLLPPGDASGQ